MVQLQSSERRRSPRARYTTEVEYQSSAGLEVAQLVDVSGGGMLIEGVAFPPVGADVWLKFKPPATFRPMFLQGRVVRIEPADDAVTEGRGFAVGFVGGDGPVVPELDELVRRFLGLDAEVSDSVAADAAPRAKMSYATEREFIDAYTAEICAGNLVLTSPENFPAGTALAVEIDLPNYYEPVCIDVEVTRAAEPGRTRGEWRQATRIVDLRSEGMRFIHDFASVFLGSRHATPSTEVPSATPSPVPDPAPVDLLALVADALADFHGVEALETHAEVVASAEAEDAPRHETKRIEQMAELVARSLRSVAADSPEAAGDAAPSRVDRCVADLADDDPERRAGAASSLGKLGMATPAIVSSLSTVLGDPDPRVRRAAAWALGDIGSGASEAVPALMTALDDADARVRWRAVRALRAIGPAASLAVPDLSRALEDEDDRVRQWAATALADLASVGSEASLSGASV